MNEKLFRADLLTQLAPEVGGVFSLNELSSLFDLNNPQLLWRAIKEFESVGMLRRYCRGIYTAKKFDSFILSTKVRGDSYISLGSALAYHKLIGTESPLLVSGVTFNKAAEFSGTINLSYSKISEELFFGFVPLKNGTLMADAEKAVADTLYFYQHKKNFHFNIFQDINFSTLNKNKFNDYIERFNNPKFRAFARNCVNGKF